MGVLREEVEKRYGEGPAAVAALRGVSLVVEPGELVVVLGPSGSGKTTLLNLVGALERPTAGSLVVAGSELAGLDEAGRTAFRRSESGSSFSSSISFRPSPRSRMWRWCWS